jgi:anthranilate synthase component 1
MLLHGLSPKHNHDLSQNNILHYQTGAGIVADSDPQSELNEVNNKMMALRKALEMAEEL